MLQEKVVINIFLQKKRPYTIDYLIKWIYNKVMQLQYIVITVNYNKNSCLFKEDVIVNKAELITSMAEKSQLTKKDAEAALKAFIDSVQEALENGDKVQLIGFGTFETRERAAREGRNPRTKETINIPASTVPVFKAGKEFKERVNK